MKFSSRIRLTTGTSALAVLFLATSAYAQDKYEERWEHDVQVSYDVAKRFTLYGGINNFTDQQPDIAARFAYPISAIGRYFYAGAKIKLGNVF